MPKGKRMVSLENGHKKGLGKTPTSKSRTKCDDVAQIARRVLFFKLGSFLIQKNTVVKMIKAEMKPIE